MNEHITQLLQSAKWFENRAVSVDAYVAAWRQNHFAIFQKALDFVAHFGEMVLQDTVYSDMQQRPILITLKILPLVATENITNTGWIEQVYAPLAQENLLPVGMVFNDFMTIMIGESGRFYGGYDDFFAILGENAAEMFANTFDGYKFKVLNQ